MKVRFFVIHSLSVFFSLIFAASINHLAFYFFEKITIQVEYHEDGETKDRVKHVLVIESPTQEDLSSAFICAARNKVGVTRKRIIVTSE